MAAASPTDSKHPHIRPKSYTVFAAAFLAGAAAAVGVNRVLDVHLAQRRPQVESEPIFVALRPLAQGSPVTVWDVALKDWPKAMLPSSALRAGDSFEGFVLRHAIREGQPLLAVQLIRSGSQVDASAAVETFVPAVPVVEATARAEQSAGDLWTPSASTTTPVTDVAATQPPAPIAVAPERVAQAAPEQPEVAIADDDRNQVTDVPAEVVTEPEPTAIDPPIAPSPSTSVAAAPMQPTPAEETPSDAAEAVATDVAAMPSVMKQTATTGTAGSPPPASDAGKYLVVPERIALQADTSFTTPRPQPPGPPAAARPTRGQNPRGPAPRTAGRADSRRGGTPTASQPDVQPAAPSPTRQQQPPTREPQSSATRRPWAPLPALAAGIESLGKQWQRPATTATRPQGAAGTSR